MQISYPLHINFFFMFFVLFFLLHVKPLNQFMVIFQMATALLIPYSYFKSFIYMIFIGLNIYFYCKIKYVFLLL